MQWEINISLRVRSTPFWFPEMGHCGLAPRKALQVGKRAISRCFRSLMERLSLLFWKIMKAPYGLELAGLLIQERCARFGVAPWTALETAVGWVLALSRYMRTGRVTFGPERKTEYGDGNPGPRNFIHCRVNWMVYRRLLKTRTERSSSGGRAGFIDSRTARRSRIRFQTFRVGSKPKESSAIEMLVYGSQRGTMGFCTFIREERTCFRRPKACQEMMSMLSLRMLKVMYGYQRLRE